MSNEAPDPSDLPEEHESNEDLMQEVEEIERHIGQYNDESELDTERILELILAAGGTAATAMLVIRYFKNKKKRKRTFSLFNKPKKKDRFSKLMKQQAALILIAIFRKEIVKLLQKLEILDEGEFL